MAPMIGRRIALGALGGLGCFALGLAAARYFGEKPPPPLPPRIVIDPASVQLLPDASLHLDLPRGFEDAGLP
jgi:hypothetical protein